MIGKTAPAADDPPGNLPGVQPGPESEAERPIAHGLGQIEYRLARDAVVREFRKGRLSRIDVCDAHPELLRVAAQPGSRDGDGLPNLRGGEARSRSLRLR